MFEDEEYQAKQAEQEASAHARALAFHDVFAKNEKGQKILAEWVQRFCTGEPPGPGASEREVGMMDGKRQIVREILNQIERARGEK